MKEKFIKKLNHFYKEYLGKKNLILLGILATIVVINIVLTLYLQARWGG